MLSLFLVTIYHAAFGQSEISIQTDRDSYTTGDLVQLTGSLPGAKNYPIAIEIKDSKGDTILIRTVETDSSGNFELKFKIPSSATAGKLSVITSANIGGEPITKTKTVSLRTAGSEDTTSGSKPNNGGGCLIATAAFGSELTPQVQFLRDFRDERIMSTLAGSSFMNVFNTWYYSFSPYVADYERSNPWIQQTVKASIYPLIGILQTSEAAHTSVKGEYGALLSGLMASSMIGALYFWPFALAVKGIRKGMFNYRIAIYAIAGSFAFVMISLLANSEYALMSSTSLFVVATLSASAMLSARWITSIAKSFHRKVAGKN